jgi:hypothetical protein
MLTTVCSEAIKISLLVLKKIKSFKGNSNTVGSQNQKGKKLELFELAKCCRLGKNLVDLTLQNFSLLSKIIQKYFTSLDASSLDWDRDSFVLRAFESTELTAAEDDELMEIRNDRSTHQQIWPHSGCLSGRSSQSSQRRRLKHSFLSLYRICGRRLLCYEHDEYQEQVAASNTGGGLQDMLVNHPTSDKGHYQTSPSKGYVYAYIRTSYFYSCLYFKKFLPYSYLL